MNNRVKLIIRELEKRNIHYKITGRTINIRCVNPNHEDRNPSMHIYPETMTFYCFGCGMYGTVQKLFNIEKFSDIDPVMSNEELDKFREILNSDSVIKVTLPEGEAIKNPIRNLPPEFLNKYLYYTEEGLVFPVYYYGTPVGYTMRSFDLNKWIHSKGKTVFGYHFSNFPYPFYTKSRTIIIVEGVFDFLRLKYYGLPAVLLFGCNFTKFKARWLVRSLPERVIIMLDGDEAGQVNTEKWAQYLSHFTSVYIYRLPSGLDPCDWFEDAKNVEDFKKWMEVFVHGKGKPVQIQTNS